MIRSGASRTSVSKFGASGAPKPDPLDAGRFLLPSQIPHGVAVHLLPRSTLRLTRAKRRQRQTLLTCAGGAVHRPGGRQQPSPALLEKACFFFTCTPPLEDWVSPAGTANSPPGLRPTPPTRPQPDRERAPTPTRALLRSETRESAGGAPSVQRGRRRRTLYSREERESLCVLL